LDTLFRNVPRALDTLVWKVSRALETLHGGFETLFVPDADWTTPTFKTLGRCHEHEKLSSVRCDTRSKHSSERYHGRETRYNERAKKNALKAV